MQGMISFVFNWFILDFYFHSLVADGPEEGPVEEQESKIMTAFYGCRFGENFGVRGISFLNCSQETSVRASRNSFPQSCLRRKDSLEGGVGRNYGSRLLSCWQQPICGGLL